MRLSSGVVEPQGQLQLSRPMITLTRRYRARYCAYSTLFISIAGISHRKRIVAAIAPASWARTKPNTSVGRIPVKVSLKQRARVTAGLAKEVEAVNQYAALM